SESRQQHRRLFSWPPLAPHPRKAAAMSQSATDDLRIRTITPLATPAEVMDECPATPAALATVGKARAVLHRILDGGDDRLAVVIGPCSIHDPRTALGWKGLINDPDLDGSFHIRKGLRVARQLLCDINALGVPAGSEFLDIISPQYLADLVAWGAIGARTTESQVHRELASGLSCPVGFKNGTDGNVKLAVDAVQAAAHPHHFLAVTKQGQAAIAATSGNRDCHVILRGGKVPNYDAASVEAACSAIAKAGLPARVMIDASHANSGKNPENQPRVIADIAAQLEAGESRIVGAMVESHLVAG